MISLRRIFAGLVVSAALLTGCGPTVTATALNPSPRPFSPRHAMSVEVYTTSMPPRPYVEVAALSAKGGNAEEHFGAMRQKAGEMGCDALVFTAMPRDATSTGYNWMSGGVTTTSSNSGSSATCVMWTGGAAPGPGAGPGY